MSSRNCVVAWLIAALLCLSGRSVSAQSETLLVLSAPQTTLSTGQFYEVTIGVENVASLWLADLEIAYDPSQIYIAGTKAGRPIQLGSFVTPPDLTAVIRNSITNKRLVYTVSLLNPADPMVGSGTLGTLRIYPLQAGDTQMTFSQAQLTTLTFTDQDGQRRPGAPQIVPFTPILLELHIQGETVAAPDESTATPLPTPTLEVQQPLTIVSTATPLVNVTRAPAVAADNPPVSTVPDQRPVMIGIGLALVVVSGGLLFVLVRRR